MNEELEKIIQKMLENGESRSNIEKVVNEWRRLNEPLNVFQQKETELTQSGILLQPEKPEPEQFILKDPLPSSVTLGATPTGRPAHAPAFLSRIPGITQLIPLRKPRKSKEVLSDEERVEYDNYVKLYDEAKFAEQMKLAKEISKEKVR